MNGYDRSLGTDHVVFRWHQIAIPVVTTIVLSIVTWAWAPLRVRLLLVTLLLTLTIIFLLYHLSVKTESSLFIFVGLPAILILSAGLMMATPWCLHSSPRLQINYAHTGEQLPPVGNQVVVAPHTDLEISATLFNESLSPEAYRCTWAFTGDGQRLDSSACRILIRSGVDPTPDIINVKLQQHNCDFLTMESILIATTDGEGSSR